MMISVLLLLINIKSCSDLLQTASINKGVDKSKNEGKCLISVIGLMTTEPPSGHERKRVSSLASLIISAGLTGDRCVCALL